MAPRIQYAKTQDGLNIAYWTMGEGPPLLFLSPLILGASQAELADPDWRSWYEALARTHRVIRYDARGSGMSDRPGELPLDALLLDFIAVIDDLTLDRVAVFSPNWGVVPGVAFAVRRPERVSRLVLWRALTVRTITLGNLAEKNWEVFSEVVGHLTMGWDAGIVARRMAAYVRESFTPETYERLLETVSGFELSDMLPEVSMPTLVVGRRGFEADVLDLIRHLASSIPHARLALLEGSGSAPFGPGADMESAVAAVEEFLLEDERAAAATAFAPSGLVTILFTDLVSSTELTQRLGDAAAQELVRAHNAIVREALAANGGSEIKHTGDGIMASFPTASAALQCAIAIQRAVLGRDDPNLQVHAGVNAGEPVAEEQDLFGTAVQLARRICDQAGAGEILVSNVVRELAAGKDFLFADRGEAALRGFEDPVRLYEVRWQNI